MTVVRCREAANVGGGGGFGGDDDDVEKHSHGTALGTPHGAHQKTARTAAEKKKRVPTRGRQKKKKNFKNKKPRAHTGMDVHDRATTPPPPPPPYDGPLNGNFARSRRQPRQSVF